MMGAVPDETDLIEANAAFYRAFVERDVAAMGALWAAHAPVWCVHPGWTAIVGRDAVLESWRGILSNEEQPAIRFSGPRALTHGEWGVVLCEERVGEMRLAASNGFTVEDGRWRMVHHQSSLIAPGAGSPPPGDAGGPALH